MEMAKTSFFLVKLSLNATSIMAVNSATGRSRCGIMTCFSTVGLKKLGISLYLSQRPSNIRTNKNFSIKSLITNLTAHKLCPQADNETRYTILSLCPIII